MNTCLQVKIEKTVPNINASVNTIQGISVYANQVCQITALRFIPLLVDEGYLLVDVNGQISYIYVDKNKDNAKRILS